MRSAPLLGLCLGASAALHLAVLGTQAPWGRPGGNAVAAASLRVVLLPSVDPTAVADAPSPTNPPLAPVAPQVQRSAAAPEAITPAARPATAAAAPAGLLPAPLEYLPRERLSAVPRPLAEIHIPYPEEPSAPATVALPMTLLIDESGIVQQVQLAGARGPQAFEQAAVSSFLAARFKPGEVGSQVVRSQLRVEVRFEAQTGSGGRSQTTITLAPTPP